MLRLPELRRFLLGLIGPRADAGLAERLTEADWQRIDIIAAQHRLSPHLHGRLERGELDCAVPPDTRAGWQKAHRANALAVLSQRRALLEVDALLRKRGITPVALKGAWCAWHAYPAASERPMRDIDLLVGHDRALDAFAILLENGFRQEAASARTPEASLAHDKHLPPLVSPEGVRFELHMRLWERPEAIGWWMPEGEDAAMLSRATPVDVDDPVHYLAPDDMLVHFTIHAALSNRLNGGPLGLIDIDALLARSAIDWDATWDRGRSGGWDRALALILHCVDRWRRPGLLEESGCPLAIDESLLGMAPDLLLQDLGQTKTVGLLATLRGALARDGMSGVLAQLSDRARGGDRGRFMEDADIAGAHSSWAVERLIGTVRSAVARDTRRVAGHSARLGCWLEGERSS
ncbi:nucleotidyltransferase domain-containing protein [Erythrobacter litoralis]|uniref:Nucleotidyltransferase family protein n=1 Tax=Erythrobacter litoralis (strain HTCC2594) TaxID=314225 RepID=Q2N714_ERYLH|nr:nucleotidyltransferase family protein [Erythrobacter litoralis]ABC64527.1 hypothetical protein ELI_12175 [Erythrobacter litoralis HTCC2594]